MEDVFPQVVFTLFGVIPVRDTVISTWVMMALVLGGAVLLRRRRPEVLEMFIDFVGNLIEDVIGLPPEPFIPFLGALLLFIAVANVFGILPIVITPTKDLNTPLALALVVFFAVHVFGVRQKGAWGYVRSLASPIFMLPLELIGQVSRTMSLTLRLFGNIVSSEMVTAVIASLVPLIAPLPMTALGSFTGVLQAYIFSVLAANYIASAVREGL